MNEKIKWSIFVLLLILLIWTRFVNLSWGLTYPFHPDERNMADALQQLACQLPAINDHSFVSLLKDCMNPHFFAYGQFPLYLGYLLLQIWHLLTHRLSAQIAFAEAVMALRIISAAASLVIVYLLVKLINLLTSNSQKQIFDLFLVVLIFIFSPGLIQFAHFGTTESLLMLFYTALVYLTICLVKDKIRFSLFILASSLIGGLAIATKISSLIFLAVPVLAIFLSKKKFWQATVQVFYFGLLVVVVSLLFSPQNWLSFTEFINSINYEISVATGTTQVFYTRQFLNTIPVLFQFQQIFPYALGWPVLILFVLGFFLLPYNQEMNLLRFSFLVYFLPTAFIYTKWTRFMAPVVPIMLAVAVLEMVILLQQTKKLIPTILLFVLIIPGVAFLAVYTTPDVRFLASNWIYKHIPNNSTILSETANIVDLPIPPPNEFVQSGNNYNYISFNFYDLDTDNNLQKQLKQNILQADYIFIPSRRIFLDSPRDKYPLLNDYYDKLFSGKVGFKQVAEFTSYPKLAIGNWQLVFPDEQAEETFTVFDHPVIRIYKKI